MKEKEDTKIEDRFPDWYYRVMRLLKPDTSPYDMEDSVFDEDISDIDMTIKKRKLSPDHECECESDVECYCELYSEGETYQGSEASIFYHLREERELRKEYLEREKKKKLADQTHEEKKAQEVQAVYDALKAGEEGETGVLDKDSRFFDIFCAEYLNFEWDYNFGRAKYVQFYYLSEDGDHCGGDPPPGVKKYDLHGHVYIDSDTGPEFGALRRPPTKGSLEEHRLKLPNGEEAGIFQFLSRDYLKIKIPKKLVFGRKPLPPSAPDYFEFVGIRRDQEKFKAEREKMWRKRGRSSSY
ncbi:uncharacterized protein KD926_003366 [Aspergillus affinis]|uniref:uncharacterized protein n=1 Tax=Aspergillus affinis TaxID=1070780 RepID=UPI0022FF0261|nr:uncharacterized protein KD926_003366 [Aspergillus affinis]KAI9043596.1 hypothetical protein KD926_003366 [Aspergillus affinis]